MPCAPRHEGQYLNILINSTCRQLQPKFAVTRQLSCPCVCRFLELYEYYKSYHSQINSSSKCDLRLKIISDVFHYVNQQLRHMWRVETFGAYQKVLKCLNRCSDYFLVMDVWLGRLVCRVISLRCSHLTRMSKCNTLRYQVEKNIIALTKLPNPLCVLIYSGWSVVIYSYLAGGCNAVACIFRRLVETKSSNIKISSTSHLKYIYKALQMQSFGCGYGLVPPRNQVVSWASVKLVMCRHMASLGMASPSRSEVTGPITMT